MKEPCTSAIEVILVIMTASRFEYKASTKKIIMKWLVLQIGIKLTIAPSTIDSEIYGLLASILELYLHLGAKHG